MHFFSVSMVRGGVEAQQETTHQIFKARKDLLQLSPKTARLCFISKPRGTPHEPLEVSLNGHDDFVICVKPLSMRHVIAPQVRLRYAAVHV